MINDIYNNIILGIILKKCYTSRASEQKQFVIAVYRGLYVYQSLIDQRNRTIKRHIDIGFFTGI